MIFQKNARLTVGEWMLVLCSWKIIKSDFVFIFFFLICIKLSPIKCTFYFICPNAIVLSIINFQKLKDYIFIRSFEKSWTWIYMFLFRFFHFTHANDYVSCFIGVFIFSPAIADTIEVKILFYKIYLLLQDWQYSNVSLFKNYNIAEFIKKDNKVFTSIKKGSWFMRDLFYSYSFKKNILM